MYNIDEELDKLFEYFDSQFKIANFDEIAAVLQHCTNIIANLDTDIIVGILVASMPAKENLPNRDVFYQAAESLLGKDLLVGLQ